MVFGSHIVNVWNNIFLEEATTFKMFVYTCQDYMCHKPEDCSGDIFC
jgi:hypothetical protein